jgi:DNA processing protein
MTEREALILLNKISGLGSIKFRKLLEYFGSARKILSSSRDKLRKMGGISEKIADSISKVSDVDLKEEMSLVKKYNVNLLSIQDKDYPENLKNIPDPPPVIYVKGKILPQDKVAIAIVGSRRASIYGLSTAERFAERLASLGICIISGMARGIDSAAHRGALKARARTIAVLGSGLANVYPPENRELFDEICKTGAVISEFPMKARPLSYNFPRRNRIISGLSIGVIIVEASYNSGALITADNALEQAREVFAIPGKVDSITSYGTNRLIQQGAKLISNIEDVIEELKPYFRQQIKEIPEHSKQMLNSKLSDNEVKLYKILSFEPKHIDEIISESGFCVDSVSILLAQMEIRHLVKQLPGKLFVKTND